MQTRNIRALSCLVLALGAGCYDVEDDDVRPLSGGSTDAGDDGEAPASTDDGGGDDRGDDGSDDGIPGPSSGGNPPPPTDPGPTCESDIGEPCVEHGDCCDFQSGDALCVNDGVNTICHETCEFPSDCDSECCAPTDQGEFICLPQVYCPDGPPTGCNEPGYACEANGYCCGFGNGEASCVSFEEGDYCSATCDSGSDCNSGCCVALNNGTGACAPDYYCAGQSDPGLGFGVVAQSEPPAAHERMTLR